MAVVRIENFGGEFPSLDKRTLPDNAAQENRNLLASVSAFRPLAADSTVGTAVAGSKSLYRVDPSQPWISSTQDRNYVRGQINGDVNKRTYYSFNDGSAPPRAFDISGQNRQLGVPAPDKPTCTVTSNPEVTWEEATAFLYGEGGNSIRAAIAANKKPNGATQHFSGSTIFLGAKSNYGLLFPLVSNGIPSPIVNEHWCLFAKIPFSTGLGVWWGGTIGQAPFRFAINDADEVCIPMPAMAYKFDVDIPALTADLQALKGPDGTTPLLTSAQISIITSSAQVILDPENYARSLINELDPLVQEFARLTSVNPSEGAPVRPTPPTRPTVPEWISYDSTVIRDPEWIAYDTALKNYNTALETYNKEDAQYQQWLRSIPARILELQNKALRLLQDIEAEGLRRWETISKQGSEIDSLVAALGGVASLVPYAVDRIIETRFYVATFVAKWSGSEDESAPSPVSDLLELDQNDTVLVTRPTLAGGVDYASRGVTHWRVYRSNTGSVGTAFQFVDELPVTTPTYTDSKKAEALAETLQTTTWIEPPATLRGIVGMPNGIMAGFVGNTVHFCEPYAPYAWPAEYEITTEHSVVGLGVFGQTLFVGTTGNPYYITGSDSASMSAVKMESNQSCSSAKSIAAVQGGVLFASPDGLCLADPTGISVVSSDLYTREDWQALNPSSMFAVEHEKVYYLFYNNGTKGCLAFDLASKKLTRVDLQADAAFVELATDTLYIANGTSIQAAFSAPTRRTGKWKSKLYTLPSQTPLAWIKVYGDQTPATPVTVRWYGDGILRHTASFSDLNPQRLPPGRWLEHEVEVESTARVTRVVLAGSTQELQSL